jgi:hypothetical protein
VINAHDVLDFPSRDVKQPFHTGISVDPSLIMICFPFEISQISLKSVFYYYVMRRKSLEKLASHFAPRQRKPVSSTSFKGFFYRILAVLEILLTLKRCKNKRVYDVLYRKFRRKSLTDFSRKVAKMPRRAVWQIFWITSSSFHDLFICLQSSVNLF